jgi:hypothetical protein
MEEVCFDNDFCTFLEYRICTLFDDNTSREIKGFWCDGVIFEIMLDEKTVLFKAYAGKTGQENYKLFLHLSDISAAYVSQGFDIRSYIPKTSSEETITVDTKKKRIDIFTS